MIKINFAWKFVNKSLNKAKQITLLTLTMAKPLWKGRYFHPENCCGSWDPQTARRTRDLKYFCRRSKNRSGHIQRHWERDGLRAFAEFPIVRHTVESNFIPHWKLISGRKRSNTNIKSTSVQRRSSLCRFMPCPRSEGWGNVLGPWSSYS